MKRQIIALFLLIGMQWIQATLIVEKPLVVVIPSYNNARWYKQNLDSIFSQKYCNYRVIYIDDCSTDGTYELVEEYVKATGQENRVTLIRNEVNRGIFANHYRAVHMCDDYEIVLNVDGDDWLHDDQVFNKVNQAYTDSDVWLTYGQFKSWPENKAGFCKRSPKHVIERNAYRDFTWRASHMRTFYAWLFKRIKLKDCLYNGEMYRLCADMVMMYPMLEMAGGKHLHVMDDLLYVYNESEPKNCFSDKYLTQLHCSRAIRNSKKYMALTDDQGKQHYLDVPQACVLIESHSRPMQLYALLESLQKKSKHVGSIRVFYDSDYAETERAYQQLRFSFADVEFVRIHTGTSFKDELLKVVLCMHDVYIAFADDELVMRRPIDFEECIKWLEHTQASAFYLGLGVNIKYNDVLSREQSQPPLMLLDENVYAWELKRGEYDWRRFISVDLALYRKADILSALDDASFTNLNNLQLQLAHHFVDIDAVGLCLEHSAVLRPQLVGNRVGQDDLCELFNYGFKIDIEQLNAIETDRLRYSLKPLLKPRVEKKYAL